MFQSQTETQLQTKSREIICVSFPGDFILPRGRTWPQTRTVWCSKPSGTHRASQVGIQGREVRFITSAQPDLRLPVAAHPHSALSNQRDAKCGSNIPETFARGLLGMFTKGRKRH